MGIFDMFKRTRKPVKQEKRDYLRKPGQYKPLSNYVRIDNIARAAGVKSVDVLKIANDNDIKVIIRKNGRLCMKTADAVYIHGKIFENETTRNNSNGNRK